MQSLPEIHIDKLVIGMYIYTLNVRLHEHEVITINLWDLGAILNTRLYTFIRSTLYTKSLGVIFIFNLDYPESFTEMKKLRAEVQEFTGDIPFLLIGHRPIPVDENSAQTITDEAQSYTDAQHSRYIETYAYKDNTNFKEALIRLIDEIQNMKIH